MIRFILYAFIWCLCMGQGLSHTLPDVVLPSLLGRFPINVDAVEMIDHRRQDPYAPTLQPRRLMVSIFAPIQDAAKCVKSTRIGYMPDKVSVYEDAKYANAGVPNGTFSRFKIPVCTAASYVRNTICEERFPLVLFSPGFGNSRLFYSAIAESVASAGFTVVAMDHPYDADIVEYPDGTVVLGTINGTSDAEIQQALSVRVADSRFLLDRLVGSTPTARPARPVRVGYFGHSLGGATAAETMLHDDRLAGGLNMDGSFFGSVVDRGLTRPFLVMARNGHNASTDASWAAFEHKSTGWKKLLSVLNTTHGTFEDLTLLAKVSGLKDALPPGALDPLLGSMDGERALLIIFSYISAFFQQVLKGTHSKLLDGPSPQFPEVVFSQL